MQLFELQDGKIKIHYTTAGQSKVYLQRKPCKISGMIKFCERSYIYGTQLFSPLLFHPSVNHERNPIDVKTK